VHPFLRPLADLIVPADQVLVPGGAIQGWRVDHADRYALTTWGLPRIERPHFFPDPRPEASPHRYREFECYRLGTAMATPISVIAGAGTVIAEEQAGPALVNTTLERYVESAWRYYWLVRELGGTMNDETFDVLDVFLARLLAIDPGIGSSHWAAVVEGW
jgi:hypothetical protein